MIERLKYKTITDDDITIPSDAYHARSRYEECLLLKQETITDDDINISSQDYYTRSIYGVHHDSNIFAIKEFLYGNCPSISININTDKLQNTGTVGYLLILVYGLVKDTGKLYSFPIKKNSNVTMHIDPKEMSFKNIIDRNIIIELDCNKNDLYQITPISKDPLKNTKWDGCCRINDEYPYPYPIDKMEYPEYEEVKGDFTIQVFHNFYLHKKEGNKWRSI